MTSEITSRSRIWAFAAYALGIIGIVLAVLFRDKDEFVMFHVKQSVALLVAKYLGVLLAFLLMLMKIKALEMAGIICAMAIGFLAVILWLIGWVNALTGKIKPLPLIGQFALSHSNRELDRNTH